MLTLSSTLIIKDFLTSLFMWQEENQIGEEKVTVGTNTCSHSKKGTHNGSGDGAGDDGGGGDDAVGNTNWDDHRDKYLQPLKKR